MSHTRSRILADAEMTQTDQDAAGDPVFVVLRGAELVGVYATEDVAVQAAGGDPSLVIPCDVLEEAP